jgi:hypothetical protein
MVKLIDPSRFCSRPTPAAVATVDPAGSETGPSV